MNIAGIAIAAVFSSSSAYADNQDAPVFTPEEQAALTLLDNMWECYADTEIENSRQYAEWDRQRNELFDERNDLNNRYHADPPQLTLEEFNLQSDALQQRRDALIRPEKTDAEEYCTDQLGIGDVNALEDNLRDLADKHGSDVLENIIMPHMYRMYNVPYPY